MKKEIITINGPAGSGKSTVADKVAKQLGWRRFSSGDFMRSIARERDITPTKLAKLSENDPEVDKAIDAKNKALADEEEIVIDSRLAFYFIPDSFKVYLNVTIEEAARRIQKSSNKDRREIKSASKKNEIKDKIKQRTASDKKRYRKFYGIDYTDPKHFDLVCDTTDKSIETVVKTIISGYKNWQGR